MSTYVTNTNDNRRKDVNIWYQTFYPDWEIWWLIIVFFKCNFIAVNVYNQ